MAVSVSDAIDLLGVMVRYRPGLVVLVVVVLVRCGEGYADFLLFDRQDRRSRSLPARNRIVPKLAPRILILLHRLIIPLIPIPPLLPLITKRTAFRKAKEAPGEGRRHPCREGQPNADPDRGRCVGDGVDSCAGDVEHDGVDYECEESECRCEPGAEAGKAEEGEVGDEVEKGEDEAEDAGSEC